MNQAFNSDSYLAKLRRLEEELNMMNILKEKLAEATASVKEKRKRVYDEDIFGGIGEIVSTIKASNDYGEYLDDFGGCQYFAVPKDPILDDDCFGCDLEGVGCHVMKCKPALRRDGLNVIWIKVEP